jgi:hypothetical protein
VSPKGLPFEPREEYLDGVTMGNQVDGMSPAGGVQLGQGIRHPGEHRFARFNRGGKLTWDAPVVFPYPVIGFVASQLERAEIPF